MAKVLWRTCPFAVAFCCFPLDAAKCRLRYINHIPRTGTRELGQGSRRFPETIRHSGVNVGSVRTPCADGYAKYPAVLPTCAIKPANSQGISCFRMHPEQLLTMFLTGAADQILQVQLLGH